MNFLSKNVLPKFSYSNLFYLPEKAYTYIKMVLKVTYRYKCDGRRFGPRTGYSCVILLFYI